MSVQAITKALALRGLSSSEKLLLLVLANYADEEMSCFPSQSRLADEACLSSRTVIRLLQDLEDRGLIAREERRRSNGSRSSDRIILRLDHQGSPQRRDVRPPPDTVTGGGDTVSGCGDAASPDTMSGGGDTDDSPTCHHVRRGPDTMSPLTTFEPSSEPSREPSPEPSGVREESRALVLVVEPLKPAKAKRRRTQSEEPEGFSRFWDAYPPAGKVAKPKAVEAFTKAAPKFDDPDPATVMIVAIERQRTTRRWIEGFIPNAATWLNQERWNDEVEAHSARPNGAGGRGWSAMDIAINGLERDDTGELIR